MLISCPKCNSVYNISDTKITPDGKKFRCAECSYVWKVYPQDVKNVDDEDKTSASNMQNDDINAMFSRLSRDTKNLFSSENAVENMSVFDKIRHYWDHSVYVISACLLVICIVLATILAYQKRYDIVSEIPSLEKVYGRFNIESVYNGRDIIFRDVQIKEVYNYGKYNVEISGKLYNKGHKVVRVLPVKASFIADNGEVYDEIIELLPMQRLAPEISTLFSITVDSPRPEVSKIRLSMEDITKE